MPPVQLSPEHIARLDPKFEDRAKELTKDAMKGVTKSKGTVALKQWWNDADFKTLAAETTLKAGVGVASGFAVGAVMAAGVAAAAVTFGVAPALGLVVGLVVSKGLSEYHYQSASNSLRRALKEKGGADRNALPLDKLPEAISKVVKKYIRVARRGKQLVGGARGVAYNLRHMNTTIRSAWNRKDHVAGDVLTTKFGDDNELKKRLLEFRYYAQMTYNTVSAHLNSTVDSRNAHLDNAQVFYAHILRQVHFTGRHDDCGTFSCYNISASEFRDNVRLVGLSIPRGNVLTGWHHARTDASTVRAGALGMQGQQSMDRFVAASNTPVAHMNTQHFKSIAQNAPQSAPEHKSHSDAAKEMIKEETVEKFVEGVAPSVLGDMATGSSDSAAGGFGNWSGSVAHNAHQQVTYTSFHSTSDVGSVPFGATVGAGVGVGADLAISFVKERYTRRQVRKKVLNTMKAVEEMLDDSHVAAADEMEKFAKLEKEDLGRIAEKIIWYGKKIHGLESDQTFRSMQASIGNDKTFVASKFAKCDDAYNLWYTIQYVLRQYGKMIANLVCMEILLLKLDTKLAHMGIGVTTGSLVAEGKATPIRPAHMKDIDD